MPLYIASATGTSYAGVSYTSSAEKTILQLITTSTVRAALIEFGVTFNGVNSSNVPAVVNLRRQTTAGTTPVNLDSNAGPEPLDALMPAASTTAKQGLWATEPTFAHTAGTWFVPPTSGLVVQFPLGQEIWLKVSDFLGITVAAGANVSVMAYAKWME
jgi:hypothetical protein